jgi:hypothetical protein
MEHIEDFQSFIVNEGRVSVKRKYTESHPGKSVSDAAPIRERVLSFLKEKGEATYEDLMEFFKGLNEETGGNTSRKWLNKNTQYLSIKEKNGVKTYSLSKMGNRVHEAIGKQKKAAVNESAAIDKISKDFTSIVNQMKDTADAWKKATGEEKEALLTTLKDLTSKKKAIEADLNNAISSKDRNIDLVISESED